LFEQAVALHRKTGHEVDESRCLTLLGQCRRLRGDLDGAWVATSRARRLAPEATVAGVVAATEFAEIATARGDLDGAVRAIDDARRWRRAMGLTIDNTDARLRRSRALLEVARTNYDAAVADLEAAAGLFGDIGDIASARRVLVERATLLQQHGDADEFRIAATTTRALAVAAGDRAIEGELDLLDGAAAISEARVDDAVEACRRAREHALAAVQPALYVGASVALSELAELRGDQAASYEALAVGWATLGDLLGASEAATVFRPHMEGLESRLGADAFNVARSAYEAHRRRVIDAEGPVPRP